MQRHMTVTCSRPHDFCAFLQAKVDAELAAYLAPAWPKPLHRLAHALAGQRKWAPAVAACRRGAAFLGQAPDVHREFGALLDRIAIDAALCGDMAGFDGRHLEVLLHSFSVTCFWGCGKLWQDQASPLHSSVLCCSMAASSGVGFIRR